MVEGLIRVFVAVPLDTETRHRLAALVRSRIASIPGSPVPPENWHLTVRFLGPIEEAALDRLRAAFGDAEFGSSFPVRWGALGAFPRAWRAGVLWIGVNDDSGELFRLYERVDAALEDAGFPPEDRPFRPHLTISRMRPEENVGELLRSVAPLDVRMRVDRVAVFESRLGRGGAKYRVLEEYRLHGGGHPGRPR